MRNESTTSDELSNFNEKRMTNIKRKNRDATASLWKLGFINERGSKPNHSKLMLCGETRKSKQTKLRRSRSNKKNMESFKLFYLLVLANIAFKGETIVIVFCNTRLGVEFQVTCTCRLCVWLEAEQRSVWIIMTKQRTNRKTYEPQNYENIFCKCEGYGMCVAFHLCSKVQIGVNE